MAATIYRPCYCTREQVMREIDVKAAAYNTTQVDRKIVSASEDIEGLCKRKFYPEDKTESFDWPNFQYAWPWELWLDEKELAVTPTQVVSGPFLSVPVVIPSTNYLLWPYDGPPFTCLQLRRDKNSAYGNNTTPQQDIQITGTFGYWYKTQIAGALTANMLIGDGVAQVSIGSGAAMGPGVGDLLIIDSERMIVQDATYIDTGTTVLSGLTSNPPSAADNVIGVTSGAAYSQEETLTVDSEIVIIQSIVGNNLTVKRGWDGTVLATHSVGAHIFAKRQLTVLRGQLGTSAAAHSSLTSVYIHLVPGLVKELAIGEAATALIMGQAGYQASQAPTWYGITSRTGAQQRENAPGVGLPGLRDKVQMRYGRQARSRVI